MFGNFIYFIVALLIYSTYQPPDAPQFSVGESLIMLVGLICGWSLLVRWQFRKIERMRGNVALPQLDNRFTSVLTQASILAIVLFGIEIHVLHLPAFTASLPLFQKLPTLEGLLFLVLFIGHLFILWNIAFETHRRILSRDLSRREFVNSHLVFNLPVLLPWLLLSGMVDLIQLLPFAGLQRALATTTGQIVYFIIFLLIVAIIAPALVQRFWGCRPLEPGPLRSRIAAVCQRADLNYADILYWPIFGGRMITAGVMGLVRRFRYLLVTRALLDYLAPEELEAVIAHEIGHVKHRHLLYYLFFFSGFMVISYFSLNLVFYTILHFSPMMYLIELIDQGQANATALLYSLCLIVLFIIYFRFIFGFFMRNFERQADTYVYSIYPSARPLIRTLEKIAFTSGQDPRRPNWHHFSIAERIAFLERCESDRAWITHHNRKIRRSLGVFILGMILIAALNIPINYFGANARLSEAQLVRIVTRQIAAEPDNANLYRLLGDISYEMGAWAQTIQAYETALDLMPENVHALNNLAWIYATCEDEGLRQYPRALELARRAIALQEAPHLLDTLAEAYFVNGYRQEAVAAARNAFLLAKDNRDYYQKQLERFQNSAPQKKVPE